MADYVSYYSGDQIDEAVGRALPGGALDTGKAPAGFGLGGNAPKAVSSWDEAIQNGWYKAPAPEGFGSGSIWGFVSNLTSSYLTQTVYMDSNPNCVAMRECIGSTWKPWEWVNPPMRLGVEYRTTERYLGKPVYCKLVNCGILPIGVLTYAHGIQNIQYCVRYNCVASNSAISFNGRICLPQLLSPADGLPGAWNSLPAGFTFEKVYIYSGSGLANCPAYATLYYTKTTD